MVSERLNSTVARLEHKGGSIDCAGILCGSDALCAGKYFAKCDSARNDDFGGLFRHLIQSKFITKPLLSLVTISEAHFILARFLLKGDIADSKLGLDKGTGGL